LLQETSTLGVRVKPIWRHEAPREIREIETRCGAVPIKLKILDGNPVQATPEYEVCARLAEQHNFPLKLLLEEVMAASQIMVKKVTNSTAD
jgi:hypothetical protein